MKLGIKVGPRQDSVLDLSQTHASFAEVWFRIDKKDDYDELFDHLQKKHIDTGLHFWGLTRGGLVPGLVYDDSSFLKESMDLMKKTIDIASQHGFSYVNIHPGFRTQVSCDYQSLVFSHTNTKIIPFEQAKDIFLDQVSHLVSYAEQKHVLLIVETTPLMVQSGSLHHSENRASVQDLSEFSYLELPAHTLPFAVANDFGHTAANCISDTAEPVWTYLLEKTKDLAAKTRLLHLGYIIPPFNGTDFHDHLDNPVVYTNHAVPNKQQMIELLKLFQTRDDVWALVEPNGQHPKNYFLAQNLLEDSQN